MKTAAEKAGVRIDSVMNMDHWDYPLSSSDPTVVERSLSGMRTSLHNAKLWGSDVVLLVPAVVNAQTSYRDAWTRSQRQIGKLIPLASELKVVIGIEEVWNKFLLSPLEMQSYVAEFNSPGSKSGLISGMCCSMVTRKIGFARWARASSNCMSKISSVSGMDTGG
jgi:hexulose-6-phosphate isomerase